MTHLHDPPAVLFGLGDPGMLEDLVGDAISVTVVGSRKPSRAGIETAEAISRSLSDAGLVVVSGMALGIDAAAHRGALCGRSATVAVLGCGPDVCYPRRLSVLYREILDRGLILSEFAPGSEPRPWAFPARNRIMAALGRMTVVVEARTSSGSLITSSLAAELGRDVGAVPGSVMAANGDGVNALLRDGAQVIRHADDILDCLLGPADRAGGSVRVGPALEPAVRLVLEAVEDQAGTADQIAVECSLESSAVAAALTRLELAGYVVRGLGGRFERSTIAVP